MTGFRLPRARRFEHQHIFRWRLKVTTKRKRTSFQVLLRITVSTLFFKGGRRQQTRPIHRRRTLLLMEMLQNKKKKRNEKRRFTFRTGAEDAGAGASIFILLSTSSANSFTCSSSFSQSINFKSPLCVVFFSSLVC